MMQWIDFEVTTLGGALLSSGHIAADALLNPAVLEYVKRELADFHTPAILRFYTEEGGRIHRIGVDILLIVDRLLAENLATLDIYAGVIHYARR